LFSPDANQLLEDVSHLHVIHVLGREVDSGEGFDDFVEEVLLSHARDLLVKREPFHDVAHVLGEAIDVRIQVRRELVGIVQELGEVKLGQIVERSSGNLFE
jgi:hypothetical protein